MNELKIAMFTDSYYPTIDGAVVSITTTSRELKRRGHEIVVFAPAPVGNRNGLDLPDRVVWLPARAFRKYEGYRMAIYPGHTFDRIREENPDIIHSHGIGFVGIQALLASRKTGIPNVLTYHTMFNDAAPYYSPIPLPQDIIDKLVWIYHRNYLRRPAAVITPTNAIRKEMERHGIMPKKWEVLPTGVDCNRFNLSLNGDEARDKLEIGERKMILSVGRVAREKNIQLLLSAFSRLRERGRDSVFVIAGSGPALDQYQSLASDLGLGESVIFTGFVHDGDLPGYYAACDAFAIASKFETQGLVVLEAMACGKPVAGINFRAIPELIRNRENGFLFEDNPTSCAEAMGRAVMSGSDLAVNARKTAEKFSLEKCTGKLIEIYESVSAPR